MAHGGLTGDITGVSAPSVTGIDDPNVPNGPVQTAPNTNAPLAIILLLCILIGVLIVLMLCGRLRLFAEYVKLDVR